MGYISVNKNAIYNKILGFKKTNNIISIYMKLRNVKLANMDLYKRETKNRVISLDGFALYFKLLCSLSKMSHYCLCI